MRRFLRITLICCLALLWRNASAFAQEAADDANQVSHGVDYMVAFFMALLILVPVCKPSRPF